VRHIAFYGCFVPLAVLLFAGGVRCAVWEFHPGVYVSYLFTDNYEGTAEDEEEDDVYAIGPSLALSCTTPNFKWGLVGHVAKNYHKYNTEDDTTEGGVATNALFTRHEQSLNLAYNYRETRERETLDQALGVRRIHAGSLGYTRVLSPAATVSLGYTRTMEFAPPPDDDVVSDGGSAGISYQMTPRNKFDVSGGYEAYRYERTQDEAGQDAENETSQDAQVARGSLQWTYQFSPRLTMGPSFDFERHTYDDPSEESTSATPYSDLDIYTGAIFVEYGFSPFTVIRISAGGSWLVPEDDDSQYLTHGRCGIRHDTRDDHLRADFMYGYAYDYDAQNDLGVYETATIGASWEHLFTPTILSTLGYDYTSRTSPETGSATYDERDSQDTTYRVGLTYRTSISEGISGIVSLISQQAAGNAAAEGSSPSTQEQAAPSGAEFMPLRYESKPAFALPTHWPRGLFEIRALYERLEHEYEDSDSITENRYSITVEVRY